MEKITTFNGKLANKKDCRFIKGEFYIKNEQCFFIDGLWYRINSGYIAFDHEIGDWKLIKNSNMVYGVINYNQSTDEIVLGYFTPNKYRNVYVIVDETTYPCLNEKILKDKFHIDLRTLKYVYKTKSVSEVPNSAYRFGGSNTYSNELNYNVRNTSKEIIANITKYTDEKLSEYKAEEKICQNLQKYLPDSFTYGIEFETAYGMIPWNSLVESGLIPLRDGSINGFEYATLAYPSSSIGNGISLACKSLNKYTRFTENESLHLHIGINKVNKSLVSILYILCCVLENEIFSMFPKYYKTTSKFKARGKDYNKPLMKNLVDSDIDTTFNNIAMYLSLGKPYEGFGANHPSDPDGSHKWQIETR